MLTLKSVKIGLPGLAKADFEEEIFLILSDPKRSR
jgi:hypothetical protein